MGQYNNLLNKVFDQMEMVGTRVLNKRSMMVSLASTTCCSGSDRASASGGVVEPAHLRESVIC